MFHRLASLIVLPLVALSVVAGVCDVTSDKPNRLCCYKLEGTIPWSCYVDASNGDNGPCNDPDHGMKSYCCNSYELTPRGYTGLDCIPRDA